jgi:hypothetical protein
MQRSVHPDRRPRRAQHLPNWEKVLWKQQPYPDNYVDDTFLKELVG